MPAAPIRVRCERCQQLIGVSRSKAGGVVTCPRCSAEVAVPAVQSEEAGDAVSKALGPIERVRGEPLAVDENALSPDFLEIRPEDLRVRPGAWSYPPPTAEYPRVEPPPTPPPPSSPEEPPAAPVASTLAAEAAAAPPVIPPIRLDPSPLAPSRPSGGSTAARDLVLPRSVVAAWSLLVLAAIGFAFVAGLLAGHYVWRVH